MNKQGLGSGITFWRARGIGQMKELLNKLSSYNLFNYLFPGVIFSFLVPATTEYSFIQKDIVIGLFVYYFAGLVVSRVGSLLLEPLLKRLRLVKFTDYKAYVEARKKDETLLTLLEAQNSYRTIAAGFLLLCVLRLYGKIEAAVPILKEYEQSVLIVLLSVLFLVSYLKQSNYVYRRIVVNSSSQHVELETAVSAKTTPTDQ